MQLSLILVPEKHAICLEVFFYVFLYMHKIQKEYSKMFKTTVVQITKGLETEMAVPKFWNFIYDFAFRTHRYLRTNNNNLSFRQDHLKWNNVFTFNCHWKFNCQPQREKDFWTWRYNQYNHLTWPLYVSRMPSLNSSIELIDFCLYYSFGVIRQWQLFVI